MRVLVLGGTGAMGKHLIDVLSEKGVELFVTSRKRISSTSSIKFVQGDAHKLEFIRVLLKVNWDAIIDFMVYSTDEFKLRKELLLNATSQYVFISSSRIYTNSTFPITEDCHRLLDVSKDRTYLSTDEYALTKARQEDLLINSGRNNWTIIRPYITYSENRLQLGGLEKEEWLYRALHRKTIIFSKDIAEKMTTLTYGLDVAKAIAAIVGKSKAYGEVFHITSPKNIRWNEVLLTYLDLLEIKLGYRPKVLMIDNSMNLECDTRRYQILYDRNYNRCFDNTKISEFIDVQCFVDPVVGLKGCLDNFLKSPRFIWISGKLEGQMDKLTGEKASLQGFPNLKQKIAYLLYRYIL